MKKSFITLLTLLIVLSSFAQEKKITKAPLINGNLTLSKEVLKDKIKGG